VLLEVVDALSVGVPGGSATTKELLEIQLSQYGPAPGA
jgi:hypothetical protein